MTARQAIDNMLSPNWVSGTNITREPHGPSTYTPYPWLYQHNLAPVAAAGLPYRMTEANAYLGGVRGASNAFASALWALDYLHWWAQHGAAGVNFHNKQWLLTDTIVPDPNPCVGHCGYWQTAPKGYGIKAFNVGGHGYVLPAAVAIPQGLDLTAYAVGAGPNLYVTIINKTQGRAGTPGAQVTIRPKGFTAASAAEMVLTDGTPGNAAGLSATLGGAKITNHSRWSGRWTPLAPESGGRVLVTVAPTTAAVVRIGEAGAFAGPIQMEQDGSLDVFGTTPGGRVLRDVQRPGAAPSAWSGWTAMPGGVQAAGAPAVAHNLDNTLEVFVPTTTGGVYHAAQSAPYGAWGAWRDLGGKGIRHLVVASNADGSLSVLGSGPGGHLWVDSERAPGLDWSGWTRLGGTRVRPGFLVAQNLDGLLQVFGVDQHAHVWTDAQTAPGTWGTWRTLGGHVAPRLGLGRDPNGRLELFGVSTRGTLWRDWQAAPGGAWHGWAAMRGERLAPGFVVGQDSQGRLQVFGVGPGAHGAADGRAASGGGAGAVWTIAQSSPGGIGGPGVRWAALCSGPLWWWATPPAGTSSCSASTPRGGCGPGGRGPPVAGALGPTSAAGGYAWRASDRAGRPLARCGGSRADFRGGASSGVGCGGCWAVAPRLPGGVGVRILLGQIPVDT